MEYVPITLSVSKMLSTMTTLIGEVRNNETLSPSDIVNELVDSSRIGKVEYGKGIIYNFKLDTQPVKDLSETSSAFTITKPNIAQEMIEIDTYKFVPLSLSEVLSRDAFLSGEGINSFFAFVMSLMEDTAQFYLFDVVKDLYLDWVPGQASQTISIDQYSLEGLTGTELEATKKLNATEIAKVMRRTINNMMIKNTNYTDEDTYIDINDGETEKNVVSCLRKDDLKLVFNDNFYTNFLADAMASVYHSEKLGEMIPGDRFVLLPTNAMDSDNNLTIAWASDKMKFALADFYTILLSILDPSTLYTNNFYHFAYGAGVFKYAPGVKFVANIITPPEPEENGGLVEA